jgi:hypothetical protein
MQGYGSATLKMFKEWPNEPYKAVGVAPENGYGWLNTHHPPTPKVVKKSHMRVSYGIFHSVYYQMLAKGITCNQVVV